MKCLPFPGCSFEGYHILLATRLIIWLCFIVPLFLDSLLCPVGLFLVCLSQCGHRSMSDESPASRRRTAELIDVLIKLWEVVRI